MATRERILTATNELLRRHGYHGTSLSAVVASSSSTTGSLYHFFPGGKVELVEATLADSGDAYRLLVEAITDEHDDPAQMVVAAFDGAADTLESTDFIDLCPIATVAAEIASSDDRLRRAADEVFQSWIESLTARLVERGVADEDATELAWTLLSALEGAFTLARTRRDADVIRSTGRRLAPLVAAAAARPARADRS